tara:strand:- start:307 stop:432 length:126 start_codon:yes stop_codon:yes gene_type:complete
MRFFENTLLTSEAGSPYIRLTERRGGAEAGPTVRKKIFRQA